MAVSGMNSGRTYSGEVMDFLKGGFKDKKALFGQAKDFIALKDTDKNGTISKEEALFKTKGKMQHDIEKMFKRVDLDKDGELDYKELASFKFSADVDRNNNVTNKEATNAYDVSIDGKEGFVKNILRSAYTLLDLGS